MNEINDEIKIEKFQAFYKWLKEDGLIPRRSERILKKTIFRNLLGCHEMTMENFQDFLEEEKTKVKSNFEEFYGKKIRYFDKQVGILMQEIVLIEALENQQGLKIYTEIGSLIVKGRDALKHLIEDAKQ